MVSNLRGSHSTILFVVTILAVLAGGFARFKGLGTWPLAVDEYYVARSIENILRSGLPEYLCGGYYTRGLIFQYLAALLQTAGLSAELAPRFVAACSSLLALPAAYSLGKRLYGPPLGLIVVAVLSLSIWEIEMARFGRMYAPFQAVFVWYLLYFLRYVVDRDQRALIPMLALSVLGVFVWEGGALLGLCNLLPPFLRRSNGALARDDWKYIAAVSVLFLILYWFSTADTRMFSDVPALPDDFGFDQGDETPDTSGGMAWQSIGSHPLWMVFGAIPLLATLPALLWIRQFRGRWIPQLALTAAIATAVLHQLFAVACILLLLLLTRQIKWRELFARAALPFWLCIGTITIFWIAYIVSQLHGNATASMLHAAHQFTAFPDVATHVARPLARAMPFTALGIFVLVGIACVRSALEDSTPLDAQDVLLVVLVVMLLAASAAEAPRIETRYVFFLYPLAILIALVTAIRLLDGFAKGSAIRASLSIPAVFLLFLASDDFKPRHLMQIDDQLVNFRIGMKPGLRSHYHPRSDTRSAAEWLSSHITRNDAIVINAFPGVDFYYRAFDYTYVPRSNQRFAAYSCQQGQVDRWANSALLDDPSDIDALISSEAHIYLVADSSMLQSSDLSTWKTRVLWSSLGNVISIVAIDAKNPDGHQPDASPLGSAVP